MKQTISAAEFKAKCLKLMDQVQQEHQTIIITKHGKPVAELIPFKDKTLQKPKSLFGYMKSSLTILGDVIAPIDEVWDAAHK